MLQRAANTEPGPSSAYPFPAGLWPRLTARPLDFQLAVTILRIESSRRSTMTDEKYRPRLNRRSADSGANTRAWHRIRTRLGGGCSTTEYCCCTVLPTTSATFVA